MNLGVLLSPGDGIENQKRTGQFDRFLKFYLKNYQREFGRVFVFSYLKEKDQISTKIKVIPNTNGLHRLLYTFLMPFLNFKNFKKINVFRVMHTVGSLPAIFAKILFQKPYLVTYGYKYHDFAKIEGKLIHSLILKIFEPVALHFSSGVIVTTEELASYVSRFSPKNKIFLIPNGVDKNLFSPKIDKKRGGFFVVLSVGRLEKQKNYLNLIRAIEKSKSKEKIHLKLVGQGSEYGKIIKLAKELGINLKILSSIPHTKMSSIYKSADIFVLPSLLEGHPKSLLEALSCGLPCIGTYVSGIKELIEDKKTGLICEKTSQDISQKIDRLIENENLRKKLAQNARKLIEEKFDIEKLIGKEISILIKIAKNV